MSSNVVPVTDEVHKVSPMGSQSSQGKTEKVERDAAGKDDKLYEDGVSPSVSDKRQRANGMSDTYERKCFILNKVMNENIGMGKFQWQLFALSGFGWFVDNIWLQGVAIILPAVQREFGNTDIAWMTFALYIGLIIGASGWGILADIIGRRPAFNATLFLSGVFGIAGGAAPSFIGLGGLLAALGIGLGGNLPVDGMLFLEFIPGKQQYLLTLLSVFWSFGQLFASLIAWAFIANYTCTGTNVVGGTGGSCDPADNKGWRYTFYTLGATTFVLFILRFVVFQLPESPKFLISKGRDAEAVLTMKEIARRNGTVLGDDVLSVNILRTAAGEEQLEEGEEEIVPEEKRGLVGLMHSCTAMPMAIIHSSKNFKVKNITPDLQHVRPLFASPQMAYTTSIIFVLWAFIGLAYPLFNAFLPLYLQNKQIGTSQNTVSGTYSEYAYISLAGIPGSIIAAFMVEIPRSGRRGAMAVGTMLTGVFVFAGTGATSRGAFLAFNCVEACVQNIMYGSLYGYTPETFPAPHRGTGDGIASALNRLFGLFSPIIQIYAGSKNPNAPVYVSGALFLVSAVLMVTLRSDSVGKTAM
ncbi:hypothetical protein CBS101457_005727 [Exobasidium rhododendri]|nr:hypothetical protein CBS101457_005727 [Exobasidium rhododendri]